MITLLSNRGVRKLFRFMRGHTGDRLIGSYFYQHNLNPFYLNILVNEVSPLLEDVSLNMCVDRNMWFQLDACQVHNCGTQTRFG